VEARGVPAVVLGSDAFLSLARAQAAKHGVPHLAVALVPHPIGGVDPSAVRRKAEVIVDEVLSALTHDPVPPARLDPATGALVVEAPDDLDAFQAWAMVGRSAGAAAHGGARRSAAGRPDRTASRGDRHAGTPRWRGHAGGDRR
jgi:hypothetical protein